MPGKCGPGKVAMRGFDLEVIGRDDGRAQEERLRNLITDIPGIRVGHAGDAKLASGTTVVMSDAPVVASVDVRGGGPGTRETALLDPAQTVEGIDAIVLSGGSAFGLKRWHR